MSNRVWQQLLALESRDAVEAWFRAIHGRQLSARRATEITAAARQAREFFRNSGRANDSVRPLLTFYGVAALSRSMLLLLRRDGGEETLVAGHGLETVSWSNTLSGDLSASLRALDSLTVRTTQGLFTEFVHETGNRICIHVSSSGVDWRLPLPEPPLGQSITLADVLLRLPDLIGEFDRAGVGVRCALVNSATYSQEAGFSARVAASRFQAFAADYEAHGYGVTRSEAWFDVWCDADTFSKFIPQFSHAYLNKQFGSIPVLNIAAPFAGEHRYSQLAVAYILSFFLGMLARYFPTHWISLQTGAKGDAIWPVVSLAQTYVESCFPELVIEFIQDSVRLAASTDATPGDPQVE